MIDRISDRAVTFSTQYPMCDMLGLNLTHPRFVLDHIDLGQRQDDTCRGDFVKFNEWGMRLVVCKGGPVVYDENFAGLWSSQSEHRSGRDCSERLYLSSSHKHTSQLVMAVLDRFLCDVEAHPDKVHLVRTVSDLNDLAKKDGRVGLLMGANRSDWFGDTPGVIRMFARLGLRMITLSVSGRELGYDGHDELRSGGRLTALGVRMIQEMNRCGILIDLAHTNEVCALDAIEVSANPVVDSHSDPSEIHDSTRSKTSKVMRALADNGGLLGIVPSIERPDGEVPYLNVKDSDLDATCRKLDCAVDIMGIESVGFGTHFNSACLPWLVDALLGRGYSDQNVAALRGGNYLRVLRGVLPRGEVKC